MKQAGPIIIAMLAVCLMLVVATYYLGLESGKAQCVTPATSKGVKD